MKKSSDIIRNRTRDLPVCSAVPQPLRHRVVHTVWVVVFNKRSQFSFRKAKNLRHMKDSLKSTPSYVT
jgi:hypothetical protein